MEIKWETGMAGKRPEEDRTGKSNRILGLNYIFLFPHSSPISTSTRYFQEVKKENTIQIIENWTLTEYAVFSLSLLLFHL